MSRIENSGNGNIELKLCAKILYLCNYSYNHGRMSSVENDDDGTHWVTL